MSDRININEAALEDVVGGALVWTKDGVYPKDNPSAIYQFNDYKACTDYIKKYWKGGAQTEETLKMLEAQGLVWK